MDCKYNSDIRHRLFNRIYNQYEHFAELNHLGTFLYLLTLEENQVLTKIDL